MRSGLIIAGLVCTAAAAAVAAVAMHERPAYQVPGAPASLRVADTHRPAVSAYTGAPDKRILLSSAQTREARASRLWPGELRSVLRVDDQMKYGDFVWNEEGVPEGPVSVRIDLQSQLISVFRAGHEIGTAVILYGADEKETPLGTFPIMWKRQDHRSSLYDAPMPYTLRLTDDGIAIHGSNVRWGAATHGCVGVPTEFAAHLFEQAEIGDKVLILRTEPAKRSGLA